MKLATCATGLSANDALNWNEVEIRGPGGKCLTFNGLNAQLTLMPCASENINAWPSTSSLNFNQKWSISGGTIYATGGSCVGVTNNLIGSTVVVQSCNGSAAQKFSFTNEGWIKNVWSGRCVNAFGVSDWEFTNGLGGPGTNVQIDACRTSIDMSQRWNFSGQVRVASACVDRPWGVDGNSVYPWTWTCQTNPDDPAPNQGPATGGHTGQQWDYYFKGCKHDVCTVGERLDANCSSCAATICATDPFCCDWEWDGICRDEVTSLCGGACL
jgi:hypothetical protein